jgi:hypothetical protein
LAKSTAAEKTGCQRALFTRQSPARVNSLMLTLAPFLGFSGLTSKQREYRPKASWRRERYSGQTVSFVKSRIYGTTLIEVRLPGDL